MKRSICLYFKVHQPFQLKEYGLKDVDVCHAYEDEYADAISIKRLADECYLPSNKIMLSNIKKTNGKFRISFSISGTVLELLNKYRPDVIESFRQLIDTGSVEILAETYFHSLSFLYSRAEFNLQVEQHADIIRNVFGVETRIFRNTELIYNNELGQHILTLGYVGILCEGIQTVLGGRTANRLYACPGADGLSVFLRNARLSDDIAFRFADKNWCENPFTADKFAERLPAHSPESEVINVYFDYETFGIHKKPESGIFDFLKELPTQVLSGTDFEFSLPSVVANQFRTHGEYNVPNIISWQDETEASWIWSANASQHNMIRKVYALERLVTKNLDQQLISNWRRLQDADHFYAMAEYEFRKSKSNPSWSAHQVHQHYKNILTDLEITLIKQQLEKHKLIFLPQTHNLY
jgi:alpha-amylase